MVIESKNILRYSDVSVALSIQVRKITLKTKQRVKEKTKRKQREENCTYVKKDCYSSSNTMYTISLLVPCFLRTTINSITLL